MAVLIENHPFDELREGQSASLRYRLTLDDLKRLAGMAAAANPEHMDEKFATSELFHQIIAQGTWGNALLATLVVTELPGPGSRLLETDLHYGAPVRIGDSLEVTVRITDLKAANEPVEMTCEALDDAGERVFHGRLTVKAPTDKVRRPREEMHDHVAGGRRTHLSRLLAMAEHPEPIRVAVVHPVDRESMLGVAAAASRQLIVPVLVGPEARIRAAARESDVDISDWELHDAPHSDASAERGVALVRAGTAEALMKGALHTEEFMHPVLAHAGGLRTERRVSHVYCMDLPTYPRPLFITDAAINIAPDLAAKRDIVQNAIELLHVLGVSQPKVALLSATEEVNPQIPSTLDAASLCKMADRGQITGGLLDGPLAFDNAVSVAAARTKHIESPVAGLADVLVVPDLESGNMLAKQLHYLGDAVAAGIVLGARVPIILTSRADDTISRLTACAIAVLMVRHGQRQGTAE